MGWEITVIIWARDDVSWTRDVEVEVVGKADSSLKCLLVTSKQSN